MQAPIARPGAKIRLITCHYEVGPSDIKLMRTDTTLDHSQKAEKVKRNAARARAYIEIGREDGLRVWMGTDNKIHLLNRIYDVFSFQF